MKILMLIILCISTGCSTVASSINYTKGTECLENGDHDQAIIYLEEAVQLDPEMGRNHTNLAGAYIKKGDLDKAWVQIRQAQGCEYPDEHAEVNFRSFCEKYITGRGLDKPGTPRTEIEAKLGEPDMILSMGNQYTYGSYIMTFQDDKLKSVGYFY